MDPLKLKASQARRDQAIEDQSNGLANDGTVPAKTASPSPAAPPPKKTSMAGCLAELLGIRKASDDEYAKAWNGDKK